MRSWVRISILYAIYYGLTVRFNGCQIVFETPKFIENLDRNRPNMLNDNIIKLKMNR